MKLQMDIKCDSDYIIPQKHLDAAIKFGVEEIDDTVQFGTKTFYLARSLPKSA